MISLNPGLTWLILGTFAALLIGTGVRLMALRKAASEIVAKRISSLKVWWLLALLWSTAAIFELIGATILFAVASAIGLREYLRFLGSSQKVGRIAITSLVVLGAVHYLLIAMGQFDLAKVFLPIAALLVFGAIRETTCETQDYIRITAGLYSGAMLMIYAFSHALFLFESATPEPWVGPAGWFLFLILVTEFNDIMQAVVGRRFGSHKVAPMVSPNKSIEGLIGGVISSIAVSAALAPLLTNWIEIWGVAVGTTIAVLAGVVISIMGFLGDINMSAIKRDVKVKDGSSIFPGMGGVIDRIDSLIFTAPAFYYFTLLVGTMER